MTTANNLRRSFRDALQGTALQGVTFHMLRRTGLTEVNQEFGIDAAAQQAGHASTKVTETHYIAKPHQAPDVSRALQKLAPRKGAGTK